MPSDTIFAHSGEIEAKSKLLALSILERMKLIRSVEQEIAARYHEGKMRCPTHLSIGQEAVATGVGFALKESDHVVSTHRSHAHYIGKGGNVPAMVAEIYGKATGCCSGKGGSMHLTDLSVGFLASTAIVGNSIPVGVGAALTDQILGNGLLCCIFFGDATVEEGVFHESANFSVLRKLPVLFVCENNLYSVYSPLSVRQPETRCIVDLAGAHGMPAHIGDGNDVWEVYQTVLSALDQIRNGGGPVFLEFKTYRWREHCGPNYDNDLGYRTEEEFLAWKERDPIPRFEKRLQQCSMLCDDEKERIDCRVQESVEAAFLFAEESPFPHQNEAFTQLYAGE